MISYKRHISVFFLVLLGSASLSDTLPEFDGIYASLADGSFVELPMSEERLSYAARRVPPTNNIANRCGILNESSYFYVWAIPASAWDSAPTISTSDLRGFLEIGRSSKFVGLIWFSNIQEVFVAGSSGVPVEVAAGYGPYDQCGDVPPNWVTAETASRGDPLQISVLSGWYLSSDEYRVRNIDQFSVEYVFADIQGFDADNDWVEASRIRSEGELVVWDWNPRVPVVEIDICGAGCGIERFGVWLVDRSARTTVHSLFLINID